jgi:hypothetical protein
LGVEMMLLVTAAAAAAAAAADGFTLLEMKLSHLRVFAKRLL